MQRERLRKLFLPVLYPFLFAIFPLLSMLSSNIGEARVRELLLPVAFILGLGMALWVVLAPVFPDRHKRALCLSLLWVPFYGYGRAVDAFRTWFNFDSMLSPLQLALVGIAVALILGTPMYWLIKTRREFQTLSKVMNMIALSCIAVSGLVLGNGLLQQSRYEVNRVADDAALGDPATYPDIYYLIFDAYTRADYLE